MTRRRALKTLGAASGFALGGLGKSSWASQIAQPPNILVIVCDDMREGDLDLMPNIQELLARQGVSFTNAHVSNPLCGPSRASYLTGFYSHSTGIWGNGDNKNPTEEPKGGAAGMKKFGLEDQMLGYYLQAGGYFTGFFGKYMNNYTSPLDHHPRGWNVWKAFATPPYPGASSTGDIYDQAHDFILSAGTVPFFAILNVIPPHYPNKAEEKFKGKFATVPFVPRPSFDEEDVGDQPDSIRSLPRLTDEQKNVIIQEWQDGMESLLSVDEMVLTLTTFLANIGQLENTYIIITSDNGKQRGEHRADSGKGQPFRESCMVPLIIRGPGVPKGVQLPHLVTLVDLLPTLMDIAQMQPDPLLEGKSWLPLLGSTPIPESAWRRSLLVEDDNFKLIRFRDGIIDADFIRYGSTEEVLYDRIRDPFQMSNLLRVSDPLSLVPAYIGVLRAELDRLVACDGPSCR